MDSTSRTPTQDPLSAEQQQQIASARQRAGKVIPAVVVAKLDAWITGIFAAMTLCYAAISPAIDGLSALATIVGCGMAVVAFNSYRGANRLRCYDLRAPLLLALNQMLLAAIIIGACLWQMVIVLTGHSELTRLLGQYFDFVAGGSPFDLEYAVALICVLVIITSVLMQGGVALYYFTRARHVREFRRQTPQWVVDLLVVARV